MNTNLTEVYHPRTISDQGIWDIRSLRFKVYGLLADQQTLTKEMTSQAQRFVQTDVLDRVAAMGDSNSLGFVIIHPGDLGLSISVH